MKVNQFEPGNSGFQKVELSIDHNHMYSRFFIDTSVTISIGILSRAGLFFSTYV